MKRKTKLSIVLLLFSCFFLYYFCIFKGTSWRLGMVGGKPVTARHIALPGFIESVETVTYRDNKDEKRSRHFTMHRWYRIGAWRKHREE